jgi:hypothetical protein
VDSDLCADNPKESTNWLTQEVCPAVNPGSRNLVFGHAAFLEAYHLLWFHALCQQIFIPKASFVSEISPILWKRFSIIMEAVLHFYGQVFPCIETTEKTP